MHKITGIGGMFFRARDPEALASWYQEHLGIAPPSETAPPWWQEAGHTVFAPFAETTDYFPEDRRWMINFRVANLDATMAHFTGAGVEVLRKPEWDVPGIGRFARIHDPEGNPIELWEPEAVE